jgi:hypothetical protein
LVLEPGTVLKTKFNPVSKWQRKYGAQTELIIYEEKAKKSEQPQKQNINAEDHNENENENEKSSDQITITQLAVVDSLLRNGISLSLKGHFIAKLPDITSLRRTLIYINLSFNQFSEFPLELTKIYQMEAIKLRNNPLKYLPDKFSNLQCLKMITLSYCKFEKIPDW